MPTAAQTWSAIRFFAGMLVLTVVFVVAHGLTVLHDLVGSEPAGAGP
jgi:hypothetical protein